MNWPKSDYFVHDLSLAGLRRASCCHDQNSEETSPTNTMSLSMLLPILVFNSNVFYHLQNFRPFLIALSLSLLFSFSHHKFILPLLELRLRFLFCRLNLDTSTFLKNVAMINISTWHPWQTLNLTGSQHFSDFQTFLAGNQLHEL